jgi:hypothetical protein
MTKPRASDLFTDISSLAGEQEIAHHLGDLVVVWAYAESALSLTLARATGMGGNMAIAAYYKIPTFEARTKVIRALIENWKTSEFDKSQIFDLVEKLNSLSAARNKWIHGIWARNNRIKKLYTLTFRYKSKKWSPASANDIAHHNATVRHCATLLYTAIRKETIAI